MTSEESTSCRDEDCSMHVKAQVMTRDESTGGWVPLGGGGMSLVGLQRNSAKNGAAEYTIIGQKLSDQTVVLSCSLKEDLKYIRANPTFHHWITEDKRFGLTFQSSADAQLFEKSIRDALKVIHGVASMQEVDVIDEDILLQNVLVDKKTAAPSVGTPSVRSLEVVMTSEGQSQATVSGRDVVGALEVGPEKGDLSHRCKVHCIIKPSATRNIPLSSHVPQTSSSPRGWRTRKSHSEEVGGILTLAGSKASDVAERVSVEHGGSDAVKSEQGSSSTNDDAVEVVEYSYVQFSKASAPGLHEYSYPMVELVPKSGGPQVRPEPSGEPSPRLSSEAEPSTSQLPLPTKTKSRRKTRLKRDPVDWQLLGHQPAPRLQCVYCHEVFDPGANRLGSCKDAPDGIKDCIEWVACACCARGMLYHCLSDADGNYGHPCVCEPSDDSQCAKWTALALLSVVVPCLWCYWPLTVCHRCGMRCGCCGPQHVMAST